MRLLDELIESMGESEIFQKSDGTYGVVVDVKIVEDLEDIRSQVEEMEEKLERIIDDGK
jgi:hypothetical protein